MSISSKLYLKVVPPAYSQQLTISHKYQLHPRLKGAFFLSQSRRFLWENSRNEQVKNWRKYNGKKLIACKVLVEVLTSKEGGKVQIIGVNGWLRTHKCRCHSLIHIQFFGACHVTHIQLSLYVSHSQICGWLIQTNFDTKNDSMNNYSIRIWMTGSKFSLTWR